MTTELLDHLPAALAGRPHASSICRLQAGWRLSFPAFRAVTIHFVLRGGGAVRIGEGEWQPFAAGTVIVVPAGQPHAVGARGEGARERTGEEGCTPFHDGMAAFTAGDGRADALMACGTVAPHDSLVLSFPDLLGRALVEAVSEGEGPLGMMLAEVERPGLGARAMLEALMQQCLILLLRRHARRGGDASPLSAGDPRLRDAVLAILEKPGASHSVESLAALAGMGRTAFAEGFSRAYGQGPIEFVQKVRLTAAARLLATTDLPVKVVAASVGYASRSHFSRAFRAAQGRDPSAFRRAVRPDPSAAPGAQGALSSGGGAASSGPFRGWQPSGRGGI